MRTLHYFQAIALALPIMALYATASIADTRIESVLGTVTSVDTLTQSYIRKTPRDERICEIKEVPVY